MTAKMWIECFIMLMTMGLIFFGTLLVIAENLCRRRAMEGKVNSIATIFVDCCFAGLNVSFWGMVLLVPAWLLALVFDFFEGWLP